MSHFASQSRWSQPHHFHLRENDGKNDGRMGVKRVMIANIFLVLFLAGCATMNKGATNNVSQLQVKVAQLEQKMEQKDQEVADLRYQVDDLSSRLEKENSSQPVEEVSSVSQGAKKISSNSASASKDNAHYVRISASPEEVQQALKNAGYYTGNIDGKIGSSSQRAIMQFQADHSLKSDGIVGRQTWGELKGYLSQQ